jgi:hypothetical protein
MPRCMNCSGRGTYRCPNCGGRGRVPNRDPDYPTGTGRDLVECSTCGGNGEAECNRCGGTGGDD